MRSLNWSFLSGGMNPAGMWNVFFGMGFCGNWFTGKYRLFLLDMGDIFLALHIMGNRVFLDTFSLVDSSAADIPVSWLFLTMAMHFWILFIGIPFVKLLASIFYSMIILHVLNIAHIQGNVKHFFKNGYIGYI